VTEVPRDDFDVEKEGQVEIIGWLYQYYNEDPHDQVVNINGGPVKTDDIPAATQLFTTDWVVRYMVDNSLGKKYLEHYPNSSVRKKLKYLLPGDITPDQSDFDIARIQVMDNAMGSGHILAYAFDVLMAMYEDQGYAKREAANSIIQNNLFGLEIDQRAFQLSYFSLMMKLRRYDRQALNRNVMPNIHVFIAAPVVTDEFLHTLKASSEVVDEIKDITAHFVDAKALGSIIELPSNFDYAGMRDALEPVATAQNISLFGNQQTAQQLLKIIATAETMTQRYDIVATNPPYLNKMNGTLKKYVKKRYKDYSTDLFSVFIWHNINMTKDDGYAGYMTPVSWMFLKSFEKLRNSMLKLTSIASLIQMETHAYFDEAYVTINTFVLKKMTDATNKVGTYLRLVDFTGGMEVQRQKVMAAIVDPSVKYLYRTNQTNFEKIPGNPIAYWASNKVINDFAYGKPLSSLAEPRQGLATADNERFMRNWYEVNFKRIKFDARSLRDAAFSGMKWFPYNKGGSYRKWYGNYYYIINWENDGYEIKHFTNSKGKVRSRPQNTEQYFKDGITWSSVTSGIISFRISRNGFIFDQKGPVVFIKGNSHYSREKLHGFLNSKVAMALLELISPTLDYSQGPIGNLPIIEDCSETTTQLVLGSIDITRKDWNGFETSWNFFSNPIVEHNPLTIWPVLLFTCLIRITSSLPIQTTVT
jgi:hypothetical protein